MAAPITLEIFDSGAPVSEPESHDYKRGFEDGLEKANTMVEAELSSVASELNATLSDMAFGYEEALQQILTKLTPLVSQISELVVPAILADTFQTHLTQTLDTAIKAECGGGFQILVSPENAKLLVSSELGTSLSYDFLPCTDLADGQAIISSGDASQVLDLVALSNALRTALQGIEQTERSQMNG